MGSTTDKREGWLIWVWKQSSVDEALSNNASNTSCKQQETNGFSICKYLRMQACSRDLEMMGHFSFATSQVRYEDNWAVCHKADPQHYSRRIENRKLFVVLFAALEVTVSRSRSKAQGLPWLFMKYLSDNMSPFCSDETPFGDSFCGYCLFIFGMSAIWSICLYFFFFLWAFGMLSFDAIQGKIIYIYIEYKFWTHSHINHICERIQHAAFAHAKRPNDHSHSYTNVRGASTSTNHLCRCKWKDKIRGQVLTVTKRKKVERKSRVCGKKMCNVASWWQLPAGIQLLLCKQCPRRCKIHYFLIPF